MAGFRLKLTILIGSLALVAGFVLTPTAWAQQREQSDSPRNPKDAISEVVIVRNKSAKNREIRFSRGSANDLYAARMARTMTRIEKAPGAAKQTKIWVAYADLSSLPGLEKIIHVKNPVTCGSIGCELIIMGDIDGKQTILLRTIGETITSLAPDKLVINQGSKYEITWAFDGARFIQYR